jgi:predicted nucleic acid-binding Zn ribbon protein
VTRRKGERRPGADRARPLGGAVDELLGSLGIPAVRSLVLLSRSWEAVCGELLARKTAPAELRNGTLSVLVCNHGWAQELQFSKPLLLGRVREILGEGTVSDIRFTVGPIPEEAPEPPAEPAPPPPSTVPLPEPDGLGRIDDPDLRATILSIQRKMFDRESR